MRGFLIALVLATCSLLMLGSQPLTFTTDSQCREKPVVNLPFNLRTANWLSAPIHGEREGCCGWASLCNAVTWDGHPELVSKIKSTQQGGVSPGSLARGLAEMDIPFAMTLGKNDTDFLEKALASRRAVMVQIDEDSKEEQERQERAGMVETHMVVLAYLDDNQACLIDCNHPQINRWMSRKHFEDIWEPQGSWAVCPLFTPVPPLVTN